MVNGSAMTKRYLVASDFDQTLSFNDSGIVLSELPRDVHRKDKRDRILVAVQ